MVDPQIDYQGPAQPGAPLAPDELEPSPPEFQKATQSGREEPAAPKAHPTSALSTQKRGRSPGPVASGSHPTNQLNLRRR